MCTLSWNPLENSYVLLFNRDENRSRALAQGPSLQQSNGVEFISPTDTERGGTWLLVNAHGISIGLLNNYQSSQPVLETGTSSSSPPSRGMLPLKCSDCASVAEAINRIAAMSLDDYPPFYLVVAGLTEASVLTWDGRANHSAALKSSGGMLTTSAFRSIDVAKVRHETFSRLVGDMADASPDRLRDFHWYEGNDGATSVKMSRPDACTHSISYITVSLDEKMASYHYSPQADISSAGHPVQSPASSLRIMLQ